MSQDNLRGESGEATDPQPVDRHVEMLRGLPRLRSIEAIDETGKVWTPPPPMVNRIGGVTQGCGGLLVMLLGFLMVLVALGSGYYLWGPALILAGGLLLTAGTGGVWNGRRTPVVVSITVAVVLLVVGYQWQTFFPVVGWLSPFGNLGIILEPISWLIVLLVVVALAMNMLSLIYWKRLKLSAPRSIAIWAVVAGVLVVLSLFLHFSEQQRREAWLNDQLDTWTAEADTGTLTMGANSNVTLGYSFLTLEEDDETQLDVRLAELDAALEAGASIVRLSASADMLFEEENPRLFTPGDDDDEAEVARDRADRIARQRATEATFMESLLSSDADLMISDSQYSPYLILWGSEKDDEKLTWDDFLEIQQRRVEYYAETFQPTIYEVINDPEAYLQYTGLEKTGDDEEMVDLWIEQTERLIEIVQDKSPDTRIGVTISIDRDANLDFYERVLALDEVDQIGFRIFQPATFDEIEDILAEHGHPADFGKELWIVETWYGYCLAPQRSMELDAKWLEVVAAFAAQANISAVMPVDYGCFLQAGGTLFNPDTDLEGRTDVWEAWQDLIAAWQEG